MKKFFVWALALISVLVLSRYAWRKISSLDSAPGPHAVAADGDHQIGKKQKSMAGNARAVGNESNRPIRFFGVVIDQDGAAIPGVRISVSIRKAKSFSEGVVGDVFDRLSIISDLNGRFSVTDAQGALLTLISMEKSGYEASKNAVNKAYWYWRSPEMMFTPNADKPEVFRMWRKAGAERLVRRAEAVALSPDGVSVPFSLSASAASSGGDFRITFLRNPPQIRFGQRNYEWTLKIESTGGGLIESQDEHMYMAPENGYVAQLVFHMPASAKEWTDEKSVNFFVKTRSGKFGRVEMKALIGSDAAAIPVYINSFVNPSGSRNLEYDSMQNVMKEPFRIKQ